MNSGIHRPKQPDLIRARILNACAELLADGHGLSIGSVAEVAEVTKGAVQHHFGTRAELLMAFYELVLADMNKEIGASNDAETAAQRYVKATFKLLPQGTENQRLRALLAATVSEPAVAEAWAKWVENDRQSDSASMGQLIARLASDGLWLSETLGTYQLSSEEKTQLQVTLENLCKQG